MHKDHPRHTSAVFLIGFLGLVLSATCAACKLSVGWEPWPPYQFETEEGAISGLDGDLFNAIAAQMPCELDWAAATWKRQLDRVKSGQLDAAIGASHTEDRAQWGQFSQPYRQSVNHLFVSSDLNGRYDSLQAFLAAGHKLGVMQDYHYGDEVMALLAQHEDQTSEIPSAEANLVRLASGRVDGILMDLFVATSLRNETGVGDKIGASSIEVSADDIYVLFSKASVNVETVANFNDVLARLQADGTIQGLIEQYSK